MKKNKFLILFLFIVLMLVFGCSLEQTDNDKVEAIDKKSVEEYIKGLYDLDNLTSEESLPTFYNGIKISYESSDEKVITKDGYINQIYTDELVELKVILEKGNLKESFTLYVIVESIPRPIDVESVKQYFNSEFDLNNLTNFDKLPIIIDDINISYESSNENVITKDGKINQTNYEEKVLLKVLLERETIKEVFELNVTVSQLPVVIDVEYIKDYITQMYDLNGLTNKDTLPNLIGDVIVSYESSNDAVITKDGKIYQTDSDVVVNLIVVLEKHGKADAFELDVIVLKNENDYPIDLTDYYISCLGLYDEELLYELRTITTNSHRSKTTYGSLRQQLAVTDRDPNNPNNIILFYLGKSVSSKWDSGSTWNREHVWPQSLGWFKEDGAGCDIHHIRPTNPSENSSRGNRKFADTEMTGYYVPRDEIKGDIARIIFYLKVRYKESDSTKYDFTAVAYSLEMLLEWNRIDPVDDFEMTRNIESQKIQGNYNPFIDYPQFADLIWGE